jgi:two-component system sensor histidine kinase BaeS
MNGPEREDWRAHRHEMWRRRQAWGDGPPWRRRRPGPFARGFGCLAAIVVLVVVASVLAAVSASVASFGPLPAVIATLAVFGLLAFAATRFRGVARSLDQIVDAATRVEDGDYTARVGATGSRMPAVVELARRFDTMVERLELDEEQRRSLLADVSHELRTPLAVIAGNIEAMIDGVHPADEAHLSAILEETRVLERLIEDLRTVALSEGGTLPLHLEPTDPDLLIDEVVRSFAGAASTAGVTLSADVSGELSIVDVDPVRIREILANLVANAIRHTPAGGTVVVRGEVSGSGDRLELRVTDSGPGIDAELLPRVFDRFVKGAGAGGSGLGLAIARHLVTAHEGSLEVEATGSGGTTFRVSLPLTAA